MTDDELRKDPHLQLLATLPLHEPDRRRWERVRSRCHARIAAGRRAGISAAAGCRWLRVLEPALVAGVSVVFLSEVVRRALLLYGL